MADCFSYTDFTDIVQSVTPFSHRCFSLFSKLFVKSNFSLPLHSIALHDKYTYDFGLIHRTRTPPHFSEDRIEISKYTYNLIDYSSIYTNLLPFPYSTDCYKYTNEEKSVLNFKSKEDCIVKHLERKEFAKCGCNKRWSYREFGDKYFSNKCPESTECQLDANSEVRLLEKVCKNNCYNEYFMDKFYKPVFNEYYLKEGADDTLFIVKKSKNYEITFNYLPKMNLVEFLCSVGGLVSMWFGISVYDIALIFMNKFKERIIHFVLLTKFEKLILIVVNIEEFIYSKCKKIFRKITIIVFSILMFRQIIQVINSYYSYEIVTRFEVQKIKVLPHIRFNMTFIPYLFKFQSKIQENNTI
jgi:hypothetical protein